MLSINKYNINDSLLFMRSVRQTIKESIANTKIKNKKELSDFIMNEATDYQCLSFLLTGNLPLGESNIFDEMVLLDCLKENILQNYESLCNSLSEATVNSFLMNVGPLEPSGIQSTKKNFGKWNGVSESSYWSATSNFLKENFKVSKNALLESEQISLTNDGLASMQYVYSKTRQKLSECDSCKKAKTIYTTESIHREKIANLLFEDLSTKKSFSQNMAAAAKQRQTNDIGNPFKQSGLTNAVKMGYRGNKNILQHGGGKELANLAADTSKEYGKAMGDAIHGGNLNDIKTGVKLGAFGLKNTAKYGGGLAAGYAAGKTHDAALASKMELSKAADYAKRNPGVVGGAALAALGGYGAYKLMQRMFSKAAQACKGLSGSQKTTCMNNFKKKALQQQISELNKAAQACNKTKNPDKCKEKIAKKVQAITLKIQKL